MFSWVEIYIGQNAEEYYRLTDLLKKENVEIKEKISNPMRNRMLLDIIFGGSPTVINTLGMDHSRILEYKIYVKKDDEYKARCIMENFRRESRN